jgi:hypothetical protein
MMLLGVLVAIAGVWAGWLLHQRLDQVQLYRACYTLLFYHRPETAVGRRRRLFALSFGTYRPAGPSGGKDIRPGTFLPASDTSARRIGCNRLNCSVRMRQTEVAFSKRGDKLMLQLAH